ncbi:MAG: LysE family translocator [Pseudomonadota bacterium]
MNLTGLSNDLVIAISLFALVTSITPGPNNIMLTASGANFGFMASMPHMLGIVLGVACMNIAVGLGLGVVFETWPVLQLMLKWLGSAYMLWLAMTLLNFQTRNGSDTTTRGRPLSIVQGALFQLVNPKAWVMVLSANASFGQPGSSYFVSVAAIVLIFIVVGYMSIMPWTAFGHSIRNLLQGAGFLFGFNLTMCALTAACIVFIWW